MRNVIELNLTNLFNVLDRVSQLQQRFGFVIQTPGYRPEKPEHRSSQSEVKPQSNVNQNNVNFKEVLDKARLTMKNNYCCLNRNRYESFIDVTARAYNIEPELIKAIIQQESGYDENAISNRGAIGLMQVMPEVAKELGVRNIYNPYENIRAGVMHFSRLLKKFNNNIELALAAYNAGEGAVRKYGGIPPYEETQNFVNRVMSIWREEAK